MRMSYSQELELINERIKHLGGSEEEAKATATVLSEADLRGFTSHGILRLPFIIRGIKSGTIKLNVHIDVIQERLSAALIDGRHGLGHYVATQGIRIATTKAKETGIAIVGIKNTNHFGIAGYYAELAMQHGLIGFVMTTTDPLVHPYGGVEPILGTNALAIGIPHPRHPILLDMATSMAARGKILEAKYLGKKIPSDWAVDSFGRPTTDPSEALSGALSSFGGVKGYGLAFMIGILAGPLVGAEAGRGVQGTLEPNEGFCTKGDVMIAIDPATFVNSLEFDRKVESYVQEVKGSKVAPGFTSILVPGEPEYAARTKRLKEGFEISDSLLSEIESLTN